MKMVSERDLVAALEAAYKRRDRAIEALASKHKGGELGECQAAYQAVFAAERAVAAARGEPHAVPLEFPVRWDTGAPLPHLLQNDNKTFLVFLLADPQPGWDGTFVTVVEARDMAQLAIVEFTGCESAKMGSPNDEVCAGHPLYGKGFEGYAALEVVNSTWIKELETINSVHRRYDADHWRTYKHYILGFHDCTFECVAQSFVVETTTASIPEALASICQRL